MRSLITIFLVWVIGFGTLSFIFKNLVSDFINQKVKMPRLINYLLIALPLILIEESLTCEIPYFSCIKVTLPAFLFLMTILYFIQRYYKTNYLIISLIFGLIGWFNEFILVGRIITLKPLLSTSALILVSLLTVLIYGVIALLPSYYFESTIRNKKASN